MMQMKKKPDIDERLAGEERQQKKRPAERLRFLQSHPARQELHIRIWRLKELKKQQKQRDCAVKVETRGSGGAKMC